MALAVGLDPYYLYQNPKGVVAGIGLIFKPSYIATMPFADAYEIIGDYLERSSKSLARPHFHQHFRQECHLSLHWRQSTLCGFGLQGKV